MKNPKSRILDGLKTANLEMINNFINYIRINENESQTFNVGDVVEILPKTSDYIIEYGWTKSMFESIGKIGKIIDIRIYKDREAYNVEIDNNTIWCYFDDCLEKIDKTKDKKNIKWYKNGKFEKNKLNEAIKNVFIKELKKQKLRRRLGDNIEVFFIDELKGYGKKKNEAIKNKLLNKRVLFYYWSDRGIDGFHIREEIMTVEEIDFQGFDSLSLKRAILLKGTPEIRNMISVYIDTAYPIAILPDVKRKYTKEDPYGEENWEI